MVWAAFLCQTNSEFQALKTACFLKQTRFGREKRKKLTFLQMADYQRPFPTFRRLPVAFPFSLHLLFFQKLCFEVVRAML